MNDVISKVFKVIGILTLSMILWVIIMGSVGRTYMWRAVESSVRQEWSRHTMSDGKEISDTVSEIFDSAVDY